MDTLLSVHAKIGNGIVQSKYVTISSYHSRYEDAQRYYQSASNNLQSGLDPLGSKSTELDAKERLRVFYDFFHPGEEEHFRFSMKRKMQRGHSFLDRIVPESIAYKADHIRIGKRFARVLYLKEYPTILKDRMVGEMCDIGRNLMLSIDMISIPTSEAVKEFNNILLGIATNAAKWTQKQNQNFNWSANVSFDIVQQQEEIELLLKKLTQENQQLKLVTLTLIHVADTKKQLDADTAVLLSTGRKYSCEFEVLKYQQREGMDTALPYGLRKFDALRTMITENAATLMGYLVEQLLPLLNVRFIAVTDGYDSNNPNDRNSIVMPVKNMVNAMYAKDFSRKDVAYYAHCRETGKVMKKDMPYGYRFSEETNNFEIDPETEPYVRMVFAWTFAGIPRGEIANRMNLLGVPTPAKLRLDKKNIWRSETARYIQINPAYAGIHVMGKTKKRICDGIKLRYVQREKWVRFEDSHEAYITKEEQKTLEEKLIQNQKQKVEHLALRQDIRDRMPDLFPGKVFCADCGRRMRFLRVGHDRKRLDYSFCVYYCDYRHKTTKCGNGNVQMNYLRMVVLDQIRALYKTACDTDEVIRLMQQRAEAENGSGVEKKIRWLQAKYQETEKQIIKTYTEYTEKTIDSETYRTTISGILAEKEQIEKQLKQQRAQQEKRNGSFRKSELSRKTSETAFSPEKWMKF